MWHEMLRCALADLRHEPLATFCQVLLIAVIVGPLMVQFGLLQGVVNGMLGELRSDPSIRQVRPVRSIDIDDVGIAALRARPEVGFVVPTTRSIAALVELAPDDGDRFPNWKTVGIYPTLSGDPLGDGGAPLASSAETVSLSDVSAAALGVESGGRVRLAISRKRDGDDEEHLLVATVARVVPERLQPGHAAFVHPDLLAAIERYKDNFAVPMFGTAGEHPWRPMTRYTGIRLYANDILDVAALADHGREALGVDVRTQAARIHSVVTLGNRLKATFAVLLGVGVTGLVFALLASMTANVERKRRSLAVLSLLGFTARSLASFPVVQAVAVATIAMFGVAIVVTVGAEVLAASFGEDFAPDRPLVALTLTDWLACTLACIGLAVVPGVFAGLRAGRIEPSEALREV